MARDSEQERELENDSQWQLVGHRELPVVVVVVVVVVPKRQLAQFLAFSLSGAFPLSNIGQSGKWLLTVACLGYLEPRYARLLEKLLLSFESQSWACFCSFVEALEAAAAQPARLVERPLFQQAHCCFPLGKPPHWLAGSH